MKNNKGFTLIELLAVMVILAIIALIATPVVMNVINNARKAAAVDSAYGIIKAAEAHYANGLLENDGNFTKVELEADSGLDYKGTKATGKLTIDVDGTITFTTATTSALTINGFECKLANNTVTCDKPE